MTVEVDLQTAYTAACHQLGMAQTTVALQEAHMGQQDARIAELEAHVAQLTSPDTTGDAT